MATNALTISTNWTSNYDFRDTVFTPLYQGLLDQHFTIDANVNRSKTINRVAALKNIARGRTTCGFEAKGSAAIDEVVLAVSPIKVNLEECADTFYDTVFNEALKRGVQRDDITGTFVADMLLEITTQAIGYDTYNMVWFGDTAYGSTAGAGETIQAIDGFFKRFASLPASSTVDVGTTGALAADAALDILKDMYKKSQELRAVPNNEKIFRVTDSIWFNLLDTYENDGTDTGLSRIVSGDPISGNQSERLFFRNIEVLAQPQWDVLIAELGLSDPHRAVFASKSNLMIGMDVDNPRNQIKTWYEDKEELFYVKAGYDLGTQYLFDNMVVYAK